MEMMMSNEATVSMQSEMCDGPRQPLNGSCRALDERANWRLKLMDRCGIVQSRLGTWMEWFDVARRNLPLKRKEEG